MVIVPALGLGVVIALCVVFGAVYLVTYTALERAIGARRPLGDLRSEVIAPISVSAGIVAAVLAIVWLVNLRDESRNEALLALTVVGFVGGLLTFLPAMLRSGSASRSGTPPPASTGAPPRYSPPAGGPPRQNPVPAAPPLNSGDPYRALMARARYDQQLVDRWIAAERARLPRASLDELCRAALVRLDQNRR